MKKIGNLAGILYIWLKIKTLQNRQAMITKDKVTEIFCIIDEFDKNLSEELSNNLRLPSVGKDGIKHQNRPGRLSESEIMTILVCYHFGTYRTFKELHQGSRMPSHTTAS